MILHIWQETYQEDKIIILVEIEADFMDYIIILFKDASLSISCCLFNNEYCFEVCATISWA